ncbi:MAG: hypothetical protein IKZ82_09605 [Clostridia bacterium]|nr:hypothetical protein [Clostridia bacterium]
MEWETFYDRWEDWAESTLIARISSLKSVGPSDEVTEVACFSLSFDASYKLITKAIKLGASFSFDDIIELDEYYSELAEEVLINGDCLLTVPQAAFVRRHRLRKLFSMCSTPTIDIEHELIILGIKAQTIPRMQQSIVFLSSA